MPPYFGSETGKAYVFEDEKILHQLLPDDPQAGAQFGHSVAIYGDYVVTGAPHWTGTAYNQGKAYVFTAGVLSAELVTTDPQVAARFGLVVDISDSSVIVSAPLWDDEFVRQGKVYVTTVTGGLLTGITASDPQAYSGFGYAVAISGSTAVVGAQSWDDTHVGQGKVYVYAGSAQAYTLISPDPRNGGSFGAAVAIDGTTVVVGTAGGKVYAYSHGSLAYEISAPDTYRGVHFGQAVAVAGDTVIVSAVGGSDTDKVYVYRDGVLVQEVEAEDPQAGANFGAAVAVNCDGNKMTVGAPLWDGTSLDGTGEELANRGRAYVLPVLIKFAGLDYNNMGEYPVPPACTAHVYLLAYDVANGTLITGEVLDNGVIVGVYSSEITIDQPADGGSVGVGTCVMVDGVLTMKATIFSPGLPITTRLVSDDGYTDHFGDSNIAVAAGYTISECSPTAAEAQRSIDSGPIYHIDYLQNTSGYPEDCN